MQILTTSLIRIILKQLYGHLVGRSLLTMAKNISITNSDSTNRFETVFPKQEAMEFKASENPCFLKVKNIGGIMKRTLKCSLR